MRTQVQNTNAVTVVDGFDTATADPTASPFRGPGLRFKDGDYAERSEKVDVIGKTYAVFDRAGGWQKLQKDNPAEYLMQRPGEPRPPRPNVPEEHWPLNLNGEPEHPWKWTHLLYLIDIDTGTISTFSSNTTGGDIACRELNDQVAFMRQVRPGAIPIISLESRPMPTSYGGTKPRPYFNITGWRTRDSVVAPQQLLAGPGQKEADKSFAEPTSEEILDDDVPF